MQVLVLVVQVVDGRVVVIVLVTPQATSSVHGSENMVAELVAVLVDVMVAELVMVTSDMGYG